MTRKRVELQPAYLLHTRAYGDTSLLIEAFTPHHGRVGLIARGAKGPKSRTRALLQPLQPLLLSWLASGELGTVTAIEARGLPVPLKGESLFCAWYLNELVMKLAARSDPHPLLFAAYVEALPLLVQDPEPALRRFERVLLAEIGYGLPLPDDLDPALRYGIDWERGPLPLGAKDSGPGFAGASLIALRDDALCEPAARRDARMLLRAAIRRQLGGKPLETPRLLRDLRNQFSARPTDD